MAPEVQATDLKRGYHPEILGEYAEPQQSKIRLFAVAALSVIGIFFIVYTDFSSFRLALLLMLCLPIALTGSIFAALDSASKPALSKDEWVRNDNPQSTLDKAIVDLAALD